jgi:hypothetical protein
MFGVLRMLGMDNVGKGDEAETTHICRVQGTVIRSGVIARGFWSMKSIVFMQ